MRIKYYPDEKNYDRITPLTITSSDYDTWPYIMRFPSPITAVSYVKCRAVMSLRLTEKPPPIAREKYEGVGPIERYLHFDPEYCHNIWQEKFWSTEVRKHGVEALRPQPWGSQSCCGWVEMEDQRMILKGYRESVEFLRSQTTTAEELDELERLWAPRQELYDIWSDIDLEKSGKSGDDRSGD